MVLQFALHQIHSSLLTLSVMSYSKSRSQVIMTHVLTGAIDIYAGAVCMHVFEHYIMDNIPSPEGILSMTIY